MLMLTTQCRKQQYTTDSSDTVSFSIDTLLFDTIFTTVGSTTKRFKIYNPHKERIVISNIQLEQGLQSQFRINVDGESGVSINDIEILPEDSAFVFVEVTIDPVNANTPMVVEDRIHFETNGNMQTVVLNAFGQDAYFHVNEIIESDQVWPTDKPHVIYNFCALDSAHTLTLLPGTKVHGYNNAILYIYKSSLICNGSLGNEIEFKQARSEDYILSLADSTAGQWRGIYFFAPENSEISRTEISNATIGIQIDTLQGTDSVKLENIRIDNSSFAGIVTQGAHVYAHSCLFGNAGNYSGYFSIGGSMILDHCTFGNRFSGQRNSGLFIFKNYYEASSNNIIYRPFSKAVLRNSIVYGPNDTEFVMDTLSRTSSPLVNAPNLYVDHSLLKTEEPIVNPQFFNSCWRNLSPEFVDAFNWDFHPTNSTVIQDKGTATDPISDLDGNPRSITGNDLGCYNDL